MKTIKTVIVEPVYVEFIPSWETMEEGKIYIAEKWKATAHLCLCGCKERVSLPTANSFWTLTKSEDGSKISFQPSIGSYSLPCQSHYVITNNKANFL